MATNHIPDHNRRDDGEGPWDRGLNNRPKV